MTTEACKSPSSSAVFANVVQISEARERHRPMAETGFSRQIAALAMQLEAGGKRSGPHGRGHPIEIDDHWQLATHRLRLLPQQRFWKKRIPRPANDRHRFGLRDWMKQPVPQKTGAHEKGARNLASEPLHLRLAMSFLITFIGVMMVTAAGALATDASTLYALLH